MIADKEARQADVDTLRSDWDEIARNKKFWARGGRATPGSDSQWDNERFLSVGRAEVAKVLSTLDQIAPDRGQGAALDFGCGVGRMILPLSEHFAAVTGVDISAEMIRQATEQLADRHNVSLVASADLSFLPDAQLDLVHEYVVFQHAGPALTRTYLKEFARVLRPGGYAVFTLPSIQRPTLSGIAHAVLPTPVINQLKKRRDGVLMQMHPIRHDAVSDYLVEVGFLPPLLQPSSSAGPNWYSFRYFAQKR